MSLKAFHIVFVIASVLMLALFGLWAVRDYARSGSGMNLGFGVAAFAGAAVLVGYGRWFLRKLKHVGYL